MDFEKLRQLREFQIALKAKKQQGRLTMDVIVDAVRVSYLFSRISYTSISYMAQIGLVNQNILRVQPLEGSGIFSIQPLDLNLDEVYRTINIPGQQNLKEMIIQYGEQTNAKIRLEFTQMSDLVAVAAVVRKKEDSGSTTPEVPILISTIQEAAKPKYLLMNELYV